MAKIKSYVVPRLLYRYRGLLQISREMEAIRDGYIYAGRYRDMNDPMEGLYVGKGPIVVATDWDAARDTIKRGKASIGIACFSETQYNSLMWAHYANGFSGICIEYHFTKLCKTLPPDASFSRIWYSDRLPEVSKHRAPTDDIVKAILSTKGINWLYEREWRLFAPNIGKQHYGPTAAISAIYLGLRISEADRDEVRATAALHGIPVFETKLDGYDLKPSAMLTP
jgi:hypothetical protein